MTWHVWLAFVAASAVIGLIPGPGVTSIVGYAVNSGRRTALASVAGMAVGNAVAITLSLAGVGAMLATSALAFNAIKLIGALYLIFLGVITILKTRKAIQHSGPQVTMIAPHVAFASNVAVATFHPKTIIFFVAFVPQFIDASRSYALQAMILVTTFCLVVATTDAIYALVASQASILLRKPGCAVWSRRAGGSVLVAAGVAMAAARR